MYRAVREEVVATAVSACLFLLCAAEGQDDTTAIFFFANCVF